MIHEVEPITLTAAPTLVNICQIISFAESGHLSHEPISCLQLHLRLKSSESSPWLCVRHGKVGLRLRRWQGEMFFDVDERCSTVRVDDLVSKDRVFTCLRGLTKLEVSGFRCPLF